MKNTGLDIKPPQNTCSDPFCPFHGSIGLRGQIIKGKAISIKTKVMAVIKKEYLEYNKKYMRYEKRKRNLHAHLPSCLEIKEGDTVQIAECRPISKSDSFVVISKES